MTTWDRFMLSFIFGYVIGRLLVSYLLAHERKKAEKDNITFMGARKMSKEEMDELMKLLGQPPTTGDDDDEDEDEEDE